MATANALLQLACTNGFPCLNERQLLQVIAQGAMAGGGGGGGSFTQGSVLFAGPTGSITEDNAKFFWNDSTDSLGVGTATPNNRIQVVGLINFDDTLHSTSIGHLAGNVNAGNFNTFIGYQNGIINTSGVDNTSVGVDNLVANTTGSFNTAIGVDTLMSNITGSRNQAMGVNALNLNTAGDYNIAIGHQAGNNVTGSKNVILGSAIAAATINQVTTGSNNIAIGTDAAVVSPTASNQLVIGNLIYGTGLDGTGAVLSSGHIGIGVTNPMSRLQVSGVDSNTSGVVLSLIGTGAAGSFVHFTDNTLGNWAFGHSPIINSLQWIQNREPGVAGTARLTLDSAGSLGVGTASPTAVIHIKAGTAAASTGPLKFTAGTLLTTPEIGTMEFTDDGTTAHAYVTVRVATVVTRVQLA